MAEQKVDPKEGQDGKLRFAKEGTSASLADSLSSVVPETEQNWKVLVVDDEEEVHTMTRLVLKNYSFEGQGLNLISSYSGASARTTLQQNPDIAIILLDVVMEQEDSGLRLVKYIRDELENRHIRIILRTGQPGQAPENEVVAKYDINDYKAKTELTSQKLFTTITSALRSWRDIQTIEHSRTGLQMVIRASNSLFEWQSRRQFTSGVLEQLGILAEKGRLPIAEDIYAVDQQEENNNLVSGLVARRENGDWRVITGIGALVGAEEKKIEGVLPVATIQMVAKATTQGSEFFFNNSFVSCLKADNGEEIVFLIKGGSGLHHMDRDLIRLFMSNVAVAYQNVNLSLEIIETQKEIIHTLGEIVETRSQETANHVLRVGKMAELLALRLGLHPEEASILGLAAPMHDVGKVGIPDSILNKPGRLTAEEYKQMQTHAGIGFNILGKSERRIMRAAAQVALQHHERWDGGGYPHGVSGEDIHIFGRITALVDVFDALSSRRVYRDPQELGKVVHYLRAQRGLHFDPEITDCFLAHLTEFVTIVRAHPDSDEAGKLAEESKA